MAGMMRRHHPLDTEHPAYDPAACGPEGRPLCPVCLVEVPADARGFCSSACRKAFRIRSSAGYARREVFARDAGVCTMCRLDGGKLDRILAAVVAEAGDEVACWVIAAIGLGHRRRSISVWQMDHRLAVVEGGGRCGLGNLRTLCLDCHRRETRRLHARLRSASSA
jgi:5-methylcytosine-specific restriction protein A